MNEIDKWLNTGAEVTEGLRLLGIYSPNRQLSDLVARAPARFGHLLKKALLPFATVRPLSQTIAKGDGRFRREWPFLSEEDCPPELKILAADMITSWHGYVDAHEELYLCVTQEACFNAARKTVNNFSQNCRIRYEFQYYKEHHRILGKHPIFRASKRLSELRNLPATALVRKEKTLRDNIWRIKHEMAKGDRPDLQEERTLRLKQKELELSEVKRMIEEYERTDRRNIR
ncbi:MAG: hypothetical protein IJL58_05280 [Bacteroidales bacterium]|nr:hypothetical protein [Bacteroidales bacterium]